MIEHTTDLWAAPCDARCITTNGVWNSFGRAVMGRGCAQEAAQRYPGLALHFGKLLKANGNHVQILREGSLIDEPALVSFPVKHSWDQRADLRLIQRSAEELIELVELYGWQTVLLPRPGCGNGGLTWAEVEPILAPRLDDRFVVVTK